MSPRALAVLLVACAASGCALGPANAPLTATYDLGIEPRMERVAEIPVLVTLDDVTASPWLHTSAIIYRLAYQDAAQVNPYSRSRWVAAPPVLVTQRLQLALARAVDGRLPANAKPDARVLTLRVAIDAFEQLIDSPQSARGVVRMRVTLFNGVDRRPHAQRLIAMERVSETVDAEGAVRAISAATDASIEELLAWLARAGRGER